MYIKDGSSTPYGSKTQVDNWYTWGWLQYDKPYTFTGIARDSLQIFTEKLKTIPVTNLCRGIHIDPVFKNPPSNGSIIFTVDGITYEAPAIVPWYIEKLTYNPPEQVVTSLFKFLNIDIEIAYDKSIMYRQWVEPIYRRICANCGAIMFREESNIVFKCKKCGKVDRYL